MRRNRCTFDLAMAGMCRSHLACAAGERAISTVNPLHDQTNCLGWATKGGGS